MKKIIVFVLCILSMLNLTACTPQNSSSNNKNETYIEKGELSTIKEQIVYEDKQLSVTARESVVGFTDDQWYFGLKLSFTNKTNSQLSVSHESVLINDVFVEHNYLLNVTMNPKETVEYEWGFDENAYKRIGIKTIGSISFDLAKYEKVGNDYKVSRSDMIRIETDKKDYVQKVITDGNVLIDEQGYKIVAQEAELFSDGEKEYYCWFYVENNTDEAVRFQLEKMSVNGFVIKTKTLPRTYVPKQTKGYIKLTFTAKDIVEYKLEPIERMYVEVAVLEDIDPHSFGEEIIKNRSLKVTYTEN